jgi:hypothetical protein
MRKGLRIHVIYVVCTECTRGMLHVVQEII